MVDTLTSPIEDLSLIAQFWPYTHGRSVAAIDGMPRSFRPQCDRPEYINNNAELFSRSIAALRKLQRLERQGGNRRTAADILRFVWIVCGEEARAMSATYAVIATYDSKPSVDIDTLSNDEIMRLAAAGILRYQAAVDLWRSLEDDI
jgi:hypothetical protein